MGGFRKIGEIERLDRGDTLTQAGVNLTDEAGNGSIPFRVELDISTQLESISDLIKHLISAATLGYPLKFVG